MAYNTCVDTLNNIKKQKKKKKKYSRLEKIQCRKLSFNAMFFYEVMRIKKKNALKLKTLEKITRYLLRFR